MKLVFIVGTGRCGSTLTQEILAKHEAFGFISNVEDNLLFVNRFGRWNNAIFRTLLGNFTQKGKFRFAPSEAFRLISQEVSPIYANPYRDLTDIDVTPWLENKFKRFFCKRAAVQKKPIFMHKYTGWPRIGFFSRIFPEAKFIHIVRDGRAVANSWLQMPWWKGYHGPEKWQWGALSGEYLEEWKEGGRSFHCLAAIGWKILMHAFHDSEKRLPADRYLKIKFEDILDAPDEHFRQLLHFCGVKWNHSFEQHFCKQKFRKDRSRVFERDLTTNQIAEIEQCIRPLLTYYHYK